MADPKPDRKKAYEDYLLNYAVNKGEGQQFDDDVKQGPPYTSRGFAIGQNEDRVERAAPKFDSGGKVSDAQDTGSAKSRADASARQQGIHDFGPKNSSIERASDIPSGEPHVSPLIQIYPSPKFAKGGMVKHGSSTRVTCNKKG